MHLQTKIATALTLAVLVVPTVSLAQTTPSAQLEVGIATLTAQLQSLEAQLAASEGSTTTTWCYTFNSNLSIGVTGNPVTELQNALQKDGEPITVTGAFDDQTASAVTAFQEKYRMAILAPYGLTHGTGYAGRSTRAKLNSLFGCTGGDTVTPPVVVNPIVPQVTSSTPSIDCPAWGCNSPEPVVPPTVQAGASASTILTPSVANIPLSGVPGTPYSQSVSLTNLGNATATWTATTSASWISVVTQGSADELTAGSLPPGWGTTFIVTANDPSLADGAEVSGAVTFTGNFPTFSIGVELSNSLRTQIPTVSQVQSLSAASMDNSVTLKWQAATATNGVTTYDVYRTFLTSECTANPDDLITRVDALSYTDSALPAGTYYYCVEAQDPDGYVGPLSAQASAIIYSTSASSAQPLTVQLYSANPSAAQVFTGASNVSLLAFDITNPLSDPVRITDILAGESLRPVSQSTTPQFNNVTLYDTTSGSNVSVGTFAAFRNPAIPLELTTSNIYPSNLVIPANSTEKFLITGNVSQYAYDPAIVGITGFFYVPGSQTGITGVDTKTNVAEQFSGVAQGNIMTIVRGQ